MPLMKLVVGLVGDKDPVASYTGHGGPYQAGEWSSRHSHEFDTLIFHLN